MSEDQRASQSYQPPMDAEELLRRYAAGERGFTKAALSGVDLSGANLSGVDLSFTDLRGANLRGATLQQAKLFGTILKDGDLQAADLKSVTGLLAEQLRGTNVCGAKLPDEVRIYDGLRNVEEMSKHAGNLFFTLLLVCVYGWLTIGTTTDALLLTNSASSPLPVIGAAVPIVVFYLVAPLFLLGLYIYLHLHLQRLWETLAGLPAVFPDGRPLDQKVYPWILNGLVCAYFPRLKEQRPPLSHLQVTISVFVAWWIGPATIFLFWARYLRRHDWPGTALQIALVVIAIGVATMLQSLAAATLRGEERRVFVWRKACRERRTYKQCAALLGSTLVFYLLSFGSIDGVRPDFAGTDSSHLSRMDPRIWAPRVFAFFGYRPFADLIQAEVSLRPANWTGEKKEDLQLVKRARLRQSNLRYADGQRAFLVGADLQRADLHGAYLWQANLWGANLDRAILENAFLYEANLLEANLENANLRGADLGHANLNHANLQEAILTTGNEEANLQKANLQNANLRGADLTGAKLAGANFEGAILKGANLTKAVGLTKRQLEQAVMDEKTKLPDYLQGSGKEQSAVR